MRLDDLLLGESESIEYKVAEPDNRDKYLKTVVAFANGRGGRIVFGVADDTREVVGIPQDEVFGTMDAITNTIQDSCEPKIIPRCSMTTIDGKTLIVVEILPGMQPPYYIKRQGPSRGVYIRVGGTTRPAETYQTQEMILSGSNRSFDQQPTASPISEDEASAFCARLYAYAEKMRESDVQLQMIPLKKLTSSQLIAWKLLAEGGNGQLVPTNGYLLLDGKHSDDFDEAYIQCAVFKGKTRSIFITHREFHGPLYEQIENAYNFVLQYIEIIPEIRGIVRQDFYEMPTKSIRESIVNAVCHRSYLNPGQIQVALFDDRLEITSPGTLTSDMTIEKMKRGISVPRNKAISEAFKYMGI
ncbi:MAG: putative DNA binding domain-containing protein, partial [Schwartzia sp.]|nr:putative DNA binding domain-containing protein [Schwartzia sp. (in: firmicutes)]